MIAFSITNFGLVRIKESGVSRGGGGGGGADPLRPDRVFEIPEWIELKYISFGSHQSQTVEHIKALYDIYKCMLIIFLEKGA